MALPTGFDKPFHFRTQTLLLVRTTGWLGVEKKLLSWTLIPLLSLGNFFHGMQQTCHTHVIESA